MAATIIIREYEDMARPKAGGANVGTYILEGPLATDKYGLPIKTAVTAGVGTTQNSAPLLEKTHFVELENTGPAEVRYAVKPQKRQAAAGPNGVTIPDSTPFVATNSHKPLPVSSAGNRVVVVEAVHSQAVISFIEQ